MDLFRGRPEEEMLEEIELLEKILRYGRGRDVPEDKETANYMIKNFGSLDNVLAINTRYFRYYKGFNDQIAVFLSLFKSVEHLMDLQEAADIKRIADTQTAKRYARARLRILREETCIAVALNERKRIIECIEVSNGASSHLEINTKKLMDFLLFSNAKYAVIAHNHPFSAPDPSQNDILVTKNMRWLFSALGIELLDHIIVGQSDEFSMLTECDNPLLFIE